jgi:hypothetical protein
VSDLHSALQTEVVGTAGWKNGVLTLVRLRDGRDDIRYSLHVATNTITLSGLQVSDFMQRVGLMHFRCAFSDLRECHAMSVSEGFELDAFADALAGAYDETRDSIAAFEKCGFDVRGQFRRDYSTGGGDGHQASKHEHMKDARDEFFDFSFSWVESSGNKGWVTHYRPRQLPITEELARVVSWLGLRSFEQCPEFDFEPCFWRFTAFDNQGRSPFDSNAELAHRWFDAHADGFSRATRLVLAADAALAPFGMRVLPRSANTDQGQASPVRRTTAGREAMRPAYEPAADTLAGDFDVAISVAGPDRVHAEALARIVRDAGFRVFYDEFFGSDLWGKVLNELFDGIFRKRSKFCVMFISAAYRDRMWPTRERQAALDRAIQEKGNDYLLPVMVEHVDIDGLSPSLGYVSLAEQSIEEIGQMLLEKLASQ